MAKLLRTELEYSLIEQKRTDKFHKCVKIFYTK